MVMAKLVLTPENQIQRLNQLLNFVESLQKLPLPELTKRPNETSWNVLEVLEHLRISYALYEDKIDRAMKQLSKNQDDSWEYKPNFWIRFVLDGQRPKGNKRPFKIKTLKKFEPLLTEPLNQEVANQVFEAFFQAYNDLKESVLKSRTKLIKHKKLTSAIGPIIKFHLPEAFEFLICHAERHKVQIDEILATNS